MSIYRFLFVLVTSCFLAACGGTSELPAQTADAARYDMRGKVISVDRASKTAQIDHEEIPGFMPRMTMDFKIKDDWVWDDLLPGSEIRAVLIYDKNAKDPMLLEKIAISAVPNPDLPQPEIKAPEQLGKDAPSIPLTNQDGKRISFKDFQGKTLALTFIYRECPLPEFCIKMSTNFSDAAGKIAASDEWKDKLRLLSISFDPARDTPEKLRAYGIGYLGNPEKPDFTIWQVAVAPEKDVRALADFFGLKYEIDQNDKEQFNHSLVTAVIGPDGKVARLITGNRWTPEQLLSEMQAVSAAQQ